MRLFRHDPLWQRLGLRGRVERLAPDLVLRRFSLPALGPGTGPFRLVFFSDLHWDGASLGRLECLVAASNAAGADAVIFGGDLAAHLIHLPAALELLSRLRAGGVRVAVRGNRESACRWLEPRFWRERYAEAGFVYLQNDAWFDASRPCLPAIVGVDDLRYGAPDFGAAAAAAAGGRAVITVSHNPDALAGRGTAFLGHLLLSGHTHGGQLRLPGLGAAFTSSRYWRQFDRGWRRRRDGALLYVTAGAGESGFWPFRRRLFCPAELVLITVGNTEGAPPRKAP